MPSFEHIQQEISAMLDIADELSTEQQAEMDAYLDALAGQESDKIDSFAAFIREETARSLYFKEESKRLAQKAKTAEERIGYLKNRYLGIMQQHGISKIKGNAYQISIRHTPHVVVDEGTPLDDLYVRVVPEKREPDKKIIAEALKGGVTIPGCHLEQSESLQIR